MNRLEWEVLAVIRTCGPLNVCEVIQRLLTEDDEKAQLALVVATQALLEKRLAWADEKVCDVTQLGRIAFDAEVRRRKKRHADRQITWGGL